MQQEHDILVKGKEAEGNDTIYFGGFKCHFVFSIEYADFNYGVADRQEEPGKKGLAEFKYRKGGIPVLIKDCGRDNHGKRRGKHTAG